jgi:ATP-binding cassette, subfamily A (ABC1), member 3
LLGLNGAGKTTLLQIITGEQTSSNGSVFIEGHNITSEYTKARASLGFVPQFDRLPMFLTVQQTLELYAHLRGVKKSLVVGLVNDLLDVFKLAKLRSTLVQKLRFLLTLICQFKTNLIK